MINTTVLRKISDSLYVAGFFSVNTIDVVDVVVHSEKSQVGEAQLPTFLECSMTLFPPNKDATAQGTQKNGAL